MHLVEMLIAVSIGGVLMSSAFGSSMAMYRFSSGGEAQLLASTMAQQVIDNARNSRYSHLRDDLLDGATTATQSLSLYQYPSDPMRAFFPRPLLRNDLLAYDPASTAKVFRGEVKETLINLTPGEMNNGLIRVAVVVSWKDNKGEHRYTTGTTISQTGIHN